MPNKTVNCDCVHGKFGYCSVKVISEKYPCSVDCLAYKAPSNVAAEFIVSRIVINGGDLRTTVFYENEYTGLMIQRYYTPLDMREKSIKLHDIKKVSLTPDEIRQYRGLA